jgi:hypothetical protein
VKSTAPVRWITARESAAAEARIRALPRYSAHPDGEECCEVDEVFGDCGGDCGCRACKADQ